MNNTEKCVKVPPDKKKIFERKIKCYPSENIQYYLVFPRLRNGLECGLLQQNYNGIISLAPTLFMMVNRLCY